MNNYSVYDFFDERRLNKKLEVETPEQLMDYLLGHEISEEFSIDGGSMYFRGQPNANYGISSSLYRLVSEEYKKSGLAEVVVAKSITEKLMQKTEESILACARENGLGRGMDNLQLLGLLQHHGMPTRLIDVTKDIRAALFFAVESNDSLPGRLFVISARTQELASASRPTWFMPGPKKTSLPWKNLTKSRDDWSNAVYEPRIPKLDARMFAQDATFLVGGLASSGGSFPQYAASGPKEYKPLPAEFMREVCTLMICFPMKTSVPKTFRKWPAYGWSIEIPGSWKPALRELLTNSNPATSFDSIYPPIQEVKRLIKSVAESTVRNSAS